MKHWRENPAATLHLAVILLLVMAGVAALSLSYTFSVHQRIQHISRVLVTLENFLGSLTDAETGQRGYIITGQDTFLTPYRDGRKGAIACLGRLRELTQGDFGQSRRIDLLAQ